MIVLAGVAFVTGVVMTLAAVAMLAWVLGFTDPTYMRYDEAVCQAYQVSLEEKDEVEVTVEEAKSLVWVCVKSRPHARLANSLLDFYQYMLEDYLPAIQ